MKNSIGIDLGTTYCAISYIDEYGKPVVIKTLDGRTTMPSAIYVDAPNFIVGEVALQSTVNDPERVVQFVKRFMGRSDHRIYVDGESYSPEFFSSIILRKLVQEAEIALGESIEEVVITVPAYFNETQRSATLEAGQLAGLKVLRLIAEPTAAALSYGLANLLHKRNILVYDLGGGTFDVTILEIDQDSLRVLAVGGDPYLGGKDFDDRIMNFVDERLAHLGEEIIKDATLEAELRLKAEVAKIHLTSRTSAPIAFKARKANPTSALDALLPVRVDFTREELESCTADLLARTEMLTENVLLQAGLEWDDIEEVLCVGGSSRMPMVREMLLRATGRKPLLYEPDECVAKGAAIQARLMQTSEQSGDAMPAVNVGHVLSHSLGVATAINDEILIDRIVPALTPLPCTEVRRGYTTVVDNQGTVKILIYEGESREMQAYMEPIGSFELDTTPLRAAGQPQIQVEFRCDENGRIVAFARDEDTGRESRSMITLSGERSAVESSREYELLARAVVH
ncbi:MAG TPA: Hsp70 family protein [Abditibacterium sp.]|jgi:molecular chaperone DnaK